MFRKSLQAFNSLVSMLSERWKRGSIQRSFLFILMAIALSSFTPLSAYQHVAHAGEVKAAYNCIRYTIRHGDTLSAIAARRRIDVLTLARMNDITNIHLIIAAHSLCLPLATKSGEQRSGRHISGMSNGSVRWYAYTSLEESTYQQVNILLRQAAGYYGLPANLVIAIARQESRFQQHVIASDGGIGVMQIMPDTAMWINQLAGTTRDPYKLQDNIFMGAFYLHMLSDTFHGNIPEIISAYNEGPWAVTHRGIFNWSYVNTVLSILRNLR